MKCIRYTLCAALLMAAPAFAQKIPSSAVTTGDLDTNPNWLWNHDSGTPGTSIGSLSFSASNPSVDRGGSQEFNVSYADYGGENYHLVFGQDENATRFVYDTYVYLSDPTQVANLELDVNQVLANGETVIFATQCSRYSGTWEYTVVSNGKPQWKASNIACNPTTWTANTWHHIQVATHRGTGDVVTHDWVSVDGVKSHFSSAAVGPSGLFLNWTPLGVLLLNFQLDGASANSGTMHGYFDQLQIYRW
jgi:hypothetical protein